MQGDISRAAGLNTGTIRRLSARELDDNPSVGKRICSRRTDHNPRRGRTGERHNRGGSTVAPCGLFHPRECAQNDGCSDQANEYMPQSPAMAVTW